MYLIVTKAVSILCSFLFNMVRFAIVNMVKNSNATEGGHMQSQNTGLYWNI